MADVPQTLSLITLAQEFRGDIVKQINRRTAALKLLRIVPGGGKNVAWAPQSSGHVAENYAEGADAANFGSDAQASAILQWGLYRSPFHVTKLAQDTAATTPTPAGNRNLWRKNMIDAAGTLADKCEKEIFVGAGTGTLMAGLDVAIGDDTNTYATIDRAVGANAYWKPTVVNPGAPTAISFALIRSDLAAIFKAGGETPGLALVGPSTFNSVANLFDANRRWNQVQTDRGLIRLDAGYEGVEVDGCMFVKAKDCTEGQINYLNTRFVEIQVLPDVNLGAMVASMYESITPDDGYGPVPLSFHYEMLAKTGPSDKAEILAQMQLVVERPNTCGRRLNVAY